MQIKMSNGLKPYIKGTCLKTNILKRGAGCALQYMLSQPVVSGNLYGLAPIVKVDPEKN